LEDETLKLPQVEPKEESVVTTTTPSPAPLPEPPPSLTSPASTGPALIQPGKAVLTAVREQVTLNTKAGKIVIELYPNAAPKTVANFKELISTGFYDGTIFHRVISNFMIQGGDPNTRGDDRSKYGQGGPGYTLPAEISLRHVRGSVAMARTEDNVNPSRESNGSQFYICVVDCPFLDGAYTVFGRVIAGLDAVDQIANSSHDDRDVPRERIEIHATLSAP
jgi:cyclophilin family peptidyl-prolyl cis-trans isomerase